MSDTLNIKTFAKLYQGDDLAVKRVFAGEYIVANYNFMHYSTTCESGSENSFTPAGSDDYAFFVIANVGSTYVAQVGVATEDYTFAIPPGESMSGMCPAATTLYHKAAGGDTEIEIILAQYTP